MAAAVSFRALVCGEEAAMCYLLQINSFNILLDCGWDDSFDPTTLKSLKVNIIALFFYFRI
jgi:hypothetical protein